MALSTRQFNLGLYREHLEDASFLYDLQLSYRNDIELSWRDVGDVESRLEAHLDALVLGGELASKVCQTVGEPGELFVALSLACRRHLKSEALALLGELESDDQATIEAATIALCREMPAPWLDDIASLLSGGPEAAVRVLARVIGYRRFRVEPVLISALERSRSEHETMSLAWALGRVGSKASIAPLQKVMTGSDESVREGAAVALLRLGSNAPLELALAAAPSFSWGRRVLALGGDRSAVPLILNTLSKEASASAIQAGAILGDLAVVANLVEFLGDEDLAAAAAMALNLITGAELYDRVFVEDSDGEDISERLDTEPDGKAVSKTATETRSGYWTRRPITDRNDWLHWLNENKARFNRALRWRMGEPYGPGALWRCLTSDTTSAVTRQTTYDELVIRYRLDIPFEPDLKVSQQLVFLERIRSWAESGTGYAPGGWYFAGQPQF